MKTGVFSAFGIHPVRSHTRSWRTKFVKKINNLIVKKNLVYTWKEGLITEEGDSLKDEEFWQAEEDTETPDDDQEDEDSSLLVFES